MNKKRKEIIRQTRVLSENATVEESSVEMSFHCENEACGDEDSFEDIAEYECGEKAYARGWRPIIIIHPKTLIDKPYETILCPNCAPRAKEANKILKAKRTRLGGKGMKCQKRPRRKSYKRKKRA